jgi:hypothetical protein
MTKVITLTVVRLQQHLPQPVPRPDDLEQRLFGPTNSAKKLPNE